MIIELFLVVAAYFVGSIPFAYIFVRSITGRDVRAEGSGNVGATNALRSAGWKVGVAVTIENHWGLSADPMMIRVILDEVQLVPRLFSAIKLAVDRDRAPGRFIMTGSANVLLIPRVSDSLAGRMAIIRLHPLSRCEILGQRSAFVDEMLSGAGMMHHAARLGDEIADIVAFIETLDG